jgi:hypothetical protein
MDSPITKPELDAALQALDVRMDARLEDRLDRMLRVIATEFSQTREESNRRFDALGERFDRVESRLEKQGGSMQAGARATARFVEWSEATDTTLSRYDRRLAEFEKRLERLEGK